MPSGLERAYGARARALDPAGEREKERGRERELVRRVAGARACVAAPGGSDTMSELFACRCILIKIHVFIEFFR